MPASPLFLPRCFAEKLGERVSRSPPRDFFSSSCHTTTPTRWSECFSCRVKLAVAASLPSFLPCLFLFLRALHTGKREEAYATPSLWLFSSPRGHVSFPPMPRWNRNRRTPRHEPRQRKGERESFFFPLFTLLALVRVFLCFPRCSRYGSRQTLD